MLIETILGGVTGLLGNVVSGIFKYKNTKLEMELDDLKFADSIRVDRMRRLVETVEYYEKKVELLEEKL